MKRKFDNVKYLMCMLTHMEDTMKTFEGEKIPGYLDEEEAKSIVKKKIL